MENLTFQDHGAPGKSGVYVVDRGEKQGKAFRYFDGATGKWSITCYDPDEALAMAGTETALGFLPFHPVAIKVKAKPVAEVKMQVQPVTGKAKAADKRILKAVTKPAKAAKAPKSPKVVHPDGTVFFREDRQKWVVVVDGKQPAARPTKEGVIKWLQSKHPDIKPNIVE